MKISEFLDALKIAGVRPAFDSKEDLDRFQREFQENTEFQLIRLEKLRQEALQSNVINNESI